MNQGSLYPALHKLTQEGWIKSYWGLTENNRKAATTASPEPAKSSYGRGGPLGPPGHRRGQGHGHS